MLDMQCVVILGLIESVKFLEDIYFLSLLVFYVCSPISVFTTFLCAFTTFLCLHSEYGATDLQYGESDLLYFRVFFLYFLICNLFNILSIK